MSEKGKSGTGLRPHKRYITSHDSNGKSIYIDSPDQAYNEVEGFGWVARSFATESVPVVMEDEADVKNYKGTESSASVSKFDIAIPTGGVHLVNMDFAPGAESALHRTKTIDFSICVMGTIEHELDSGEKVTLYPGDHIVQRGTMHKWINASKTEPARAVAVTVPAVAFEIPGTGKMLDLEYLPKPKI